MAQAPFGTRPALGVGQTASIGNQVVGIYSYGWSGLQCVGRIAIGVAGYYLPPEGTYSITIRDNFCKGKKTESTSMSDILTNVKSISYNEAFKNIVFTFNSAPFGTSDAMVLISFDGSITRTA